MAWLIADINSGSPQVWLARGSTPPAAGGRGRSGHRAGAPSRAAQMDPVLLHLRLLQHDGHARRAAASTDGSIPMTLIARLRGRAGSGASVDPAARDVLVSSISLVAGKVAVMGFRFLSWVVAARLYSVDDFGLASGAVAAVTLCAQLALLGIGSAIITLLPRYGERSDRLLDVAITVLSVSSLVAGLGFLAFAGTFLTELRVVATEPIYALLFLSLAACGTLGVLFDQASTARRHGVLVMVRGVAAGIVTLATVAVIGLSGTGATAGHLRGLGRRWIGHRFRRALDDASSRRPLPLSAGGRPGPQPRGRKDRPAELCADAGRAGAWVRAAGDRRGAPVAGRQCRLVCRLDDGLGRLHHPHPDRYDLLRRDQRT